MIIEPLANILTPEGLGLPNLNALMPNVNNYKTLLFQPEGEITVSPTGIQNKDRARAFAQFGGFLRRAHDTRADVAICPEYSMPWRLLVESIKAGPRPRPGELWALGCESITYKELNAIKAELQPFGTVVSEILPEVNDRFLSPLVYLFLAPVLADAAQSRLVMLVQFKTHPMSHPTNFEVTNLQCGSVVYRLTGPGTSVNLVSIICSDALDFRDEQARDIYDRCLIIHIQLNKDPRNVEFRSYRDKLLKYPDDVTELICLNWAGDIVSWHEQARQDWKNVAGSAWYSKSKKFDLNDATLAENHRRGLYYTWLKPLQFHATFFNYTPAIFELENSKVFHHQVAAINSRRRGPQLRSVMCWDNAAGEWINQQTADDGFESIVSEAGSAEKDLRACWERCPFSVERVLALTAGTTEASAEWHHLQQLDSCMIDGGEIILRMTFCQDTNTNAKRFKVNRLRRCRELFHFLQNAAELPPNLSDLKAGFSLEWTVRRPEQNIKSSSGEYATAIYMGEGSGQEDVEAAFARAADRMRFAFATPNEILAAKQRLGVWYREDGQVRQFKPDYLIGIDKIDESSVDIGRSD